MWWNIFNFKERTGWNKTTDTANKDNNVHLFACRGSRYSAFATPNTMPMVFADSQWDDICSCKAPLMALPTWIRSCYQPLAGLLGDHYYCFRIYNISFFFHLGDLMNSICLIVLHIFYPMSNGSLIRLTFQLLRIYYIPGFLLVALLK